MGKRFVVIALLLCLTFLTTSVYAGHGKMKEGGMDLEDKFYKKAMTIIENQEDLGLSDAEVKRIKDLKIATKKDLIAKKAAIDLLAIDIKVALGEDTIDLNSVNGLIDQKYELKKEKTKATVAAYAELKNSLTEEQRKKLKSLCGSGKGKKMMKRGS